MESGSYSESNSWLAFADDLLWSRKPDKVEGRMFRNMICQQLLFVETCIIVDSWWLTNPILKHQLAGSDLFRAFGEGWISPAIERGYSSGGLYSRWSEQISLPADRRFSRLVDEPGAGEFLSEVDKAARFVEYDRELLAEFFQNVLNRVLFSRTALAQFGLAKEAGRLSKLVTKKQAHGEKVTNEDLYREFSHDPVLQKRVMQMVRPIYLLNAPVNYGFNITLAGKDTSRLFTSVRGLLTGIVGDPEISAGVRLTGSTELFKDLQIENHVLQNAGMLSFDEIANARAALFDDFRCAYIEYCNKKVPLSYFEEAFRTYQSDLVDFLSQRNSSFDAYAWQQLKGAAELIRITKPFAGPVAGSLVDPSFTVFVSASVNALVDTIQRRLETIADTLKLSAKRKGSLRLMTRLDAWRANDKRAPRLPDYGVPKLGEPLR